LLFGLKVQKSKVQCGLDEAVLDDRMTVFCSFPEVYLGWKCNRIIGLGEGISAKVPHPKGLCLKSSSDWGYGRGLDECEVASGWEPGLRFGMAVAPRLGCA
jgi:hypothetical protein